MIKLLYCADAEPFSSIPPQIVELKGQFKEELLPELENRFIRRRPRRFFTFAGDAKGKAHEVIIETGGQKIIAKEKELIEPLVSNSYSIKLLELPCPPPVIGNPYNSVRSADRGRRPTSILSILGIVLTSGYKWFG